MIVYLQEYPFQGKEFYMSKAWYEGLPEDAFVTEKDKAYEETTAKIREGLAKGLDFDKACATIDIKDKTLKMHIIDDMLKVLIAEEHFQHNVPLADLSKKLNVSVERLESAKLEMLEDIKNSSIKAFYKSLGSGNA